MELKHIFLLALVALGLVLPSFLSDYQLHVAIVGFYYVMLTAAWNILAGRAAIFSLGIHALAGLAAYVSALGMTHLKIPMWTSMPLGVATAALLSLVLATITLRMRGIYLALATWAFAEISRLVISIEYQITRGDLGLQTALIFSLHDLIKYYYLFFGLMMATVAFLHFFMNSPYGLFVWATGQDATAASTSGLNVYRWRIIATVITGTVAGVAGVFYGHYIGVLAPSILGFHEMATIIMMAIIGGFGNIFGAVLGALTLQVLLESFRVYREWRLVVFAIAVLVTVRVYREGLVGLLKKYVVLPK
ncbi:MAG: branched-chain amino acid ABC transporter permease [Candidatus Caldarchaeum sp.]